MIKSALATCSYGNHLEHSPAFFKVVFFFIALKHFEMCKQSFRQQDIPPTLNNYDFCPLILVREVPTSKIDLYCNSSKYCTNLDS